MKKLVETALILTLAFNAVPVIAGGYVDHEDAGRKESKQKNFVFGALAVTAVAVTLGAAGGMVAAESMREKTAEEKRAEKRAYLKKNNLLVPAASCELQHKYSSRPVVDCPLKPTTTRKQVERNERAFGGLIGSRGRQPVARARMNRFSRNVR